MPLVSGLDGRIGVVDDDTYRRLKAYTAVHLLEIALRNRQYPQASVFISAARIAIHDGFRDPIPDGGDFVN